MTTDVLDSELIRPLIIFAGQCHPILRLIITEGYDQRTRTELMISSPCTGANLIRAVSESSRVNNLQSIISTYRSLILPVRCCLTLFRQKRNYRRLRRLKRTAEICRNCRISFKSSIFDIFLLSRNTSAGTTVEFFRNLAIKTLKFRRASNNSGRFSILYTSVKQERILSGTNELSNSIDIEAYPRLKILTLLRSFRLDSSRGMFEAYVLQLSA